METLIRFKVIAVFKIVPVEIIRTCGVVKTQRFEGSMRKGGAGIRTARAGARLLVDSVKPIGKINLQSLRGIGAIIRVS